MATSYTIKAAGRTWTIPVALHQVMIFTPGSKSRVPASAITCRSDKGDEITLVRYEPFCWRDEPFGPASGYLVINRQGEVLFGSSYLDRALEMALKKS